MAKQRGRPKSGQTIEKERIEAMFKDCSAHINRTPSPLQKEINTNLAANKNIEEELIADYSPTIPVTLIFELASLGDESMYGHEKTVLKKYERLRNAENYGRLSGAKATAEKAQLRADAVWGKNKDLINKIGSQYTVHKASQKILDEWNTRGDDGMKPSIRSVQSWYRRFIFK